MYIEKDPLEMNNLVNDVDNKETITELRKKLVRWMEKTMIRQQIFYVS